MCGLQLKVCPNCGFRDPPEWKHLKFGIYRDYCTIEDFARIQPQMAMKLWKNPKIICDDYHCYHLTSGGFVHRLMKELCPDGKWFYGSNVYEKPKDPFQRKLGEFDQAKG